MKSALWGRWRSAAAGAVVAILAVGCDSTDKSGSEVESPDEGAGGQTAPAVEPAPAEAPPDEVARPETPEVAAESSERAPVDDGKAEVPEEVPEPVREPWTLAHAGFAAHLPPDVDFYVDARKLEWAAKLVEGLGLGDMIAKLLASPPVHELESRAAELLGHGRMAAAKDLVPLLLSDEAFLAARGLALAGEAVLEVSAEHNRLNGAAMARAMAAGDIFLMVEDETGSTVGAEIVKWLVANAQRVEDSNFAIYFGGRIKGGGAGEVAGRIARQLGEVAEEIEVVQPASWESAGITWSGAEVTLGEIAWFAEAEAPEGTSEEDWEKLKEAAGAWKIVAGSAAVDGFAVVGVGLGREAIELAERPEESLAANEAARFFEQFDAHAVQGTAWASKPLVESAANCLSDRPMFLGVEEGLKNSPDLRFGAAMANALHEFNDHWLELEKGGAHEYVAAAVAGDDLRVESRGGWLGAGLDLVSPLEFGKAFDAMADKLFVRAHWKQAAEYRALVQKLAEAGKRFLRLVVEESMEVAASEAEEGGDDEEVEKLARWKRDLLKGIDDLWDGYDQHFSHALGPEAALALDLEGKMVPAPNVSEAILKKGRIPRGAYLQPVVKRDALSESWLLWHRAASNLYGIMAEAMGQPIPFPDTMTAEKDDLRTYFFDFPLVSDDFMPSVSVSDELFILGTSKTLSESLYAAWTGALDVQGEPGLHVEVNATPLWDFCAAWLDVYESRLEAEEDEGTPEEAEAGEEAVEDDGPALEELHPDGVEGRVVPIDEIDAVPEPEVEPGVEEVQPLEEPEHEAPNDESEGSEEEDGDPEEADPEEAEERAELADLGIEMEDLDAEGFDESGLATRLGLDALFSDGELLRSILERARAFRGITYRRWIEDGVPRATVRLKAAAP